MKKRTIIIATLILIMLAFPLSAKSSFTEEGYQCLEEEINSKGCSALNLEENIFSVLSTGKCASNLKSKASDKNCWGNPSCSIKETALATIALKTNGENVTSYTQWIENETLIEKTIEWFIQINADDTECTLNASDGSFKAEISPDGKLTKKSSDSSCFSIDDSGYKISLKSGCYSEGISISCKKEFSTTTQFKGKNSVVLHILETNQQKSSTQKPEINSFCLGSGNSCSYEGTLWGALALHINSGNYQKYLPYIISFKDSNSKYLPDSHLYKMTGIEDYASSLKSKQKKEGFWFESGNEYYDTSLALLPFIDENSKEKNKAINWTKESQGKDGCWNKKSIKDTGFLLFAIEPQAKTPVTKNNDTKNPSCESEGYSCLKSESACTETGGKKLSEYKCSWSSEVCCTKEEKPKTCNDIGGTICPIEKTCSGTRKNNIEVSSGFCCKGTCEEKTQETSQCEKKFGECKSSCEKDETKNSTFSCLKSSNVCCMKEPEKESFLGKNLLLIIILAVIIILAILSIIFRKKIAKIFKKDSSERSRGKSKGKPGRRPPGHPPKRGPLPKPQTPQTRQPFQPPKRNRKREEEEVFNKLKQMGK